MEHLLSREILRVNRSKRRFNAATSRGYTVLRKGMQCLYRNPMDRMIMATSQSIKDPSISVTHLSSKPHFCTKRTDLHHITGSSSAKNDLKRKMCVFLELIFSPKSGLKKQVVPIVNSIQSTISSRSSN